MKLLQGLKKYMVLTLLVCGRFTQLEIGEPRQKIEVEIDMLNPDFYTIATTSGMGSRYDPTASTTHGLSLFQPSRG